MEPHPSGPCAAHLIARLEDLQALAQRLLQAPIVAVDTESDSLYSYTEKVCLVQFSLPGEDFIVDPLTIYSLEPLAEVFASPDVEKVFHGADYDLVSLKRQYGFSFANIFDTMVAARILGRKSIGLAALVAEHMGISLDKSMQRSDWGRRPLSLEQLAYACHDTRYLIELRNLLLAELQATGREEEAREAFAELAALEPKPRIFDPDGFWNIKGVHDLDPTGQHVARALYRWRDEQARWEDRPTFKVISDRLIVEIARQRPSYEDLRRLRLLSLYQMMRYGRQIAEVVSKAQRASGKLEPPRPAQTHRADAKTLHVYEHLRAWRKERATRRGVEPDVIASNDLLMALAETKPQSEADLATVPGLGPWRRKEYGPELLQVIAAALGRREKRRQK